MFLFLLFVFVDDLQPDLSGNPFLLLEMLWQKRLGAEGINEMKVNAFIEVYERSSSCHKK